MAFGPKLTTDLSPFVPTDSGEAGAPSAARPPIALLLSPPGGPGSPRCQSPPGPPPATDRCRFPRYRREYRLTWLGVKLCDDHWALICDDDAQREKLRRVADRVLAAAMNGGAAR